MGWRSHGHASVDASSPRAWATCDRCGFNFNLCNLSWQFDWAGTVMINKGLLVCDRCLDDPSPWLRTIILPADPPPVINARPEPYAVDEANWDILTSDGATILASDRSFVFTSQ